ncbi:hypothetical protein [Marinitenerispora sediminis]|uniref:hypothetical protein n=1 Tax=Marinitenerispora sediminis TaxID=1931232 RepID=UPI0015F1676D|nr:hypothetical protein [Marinitenerispora sediminis]
MSLSHEGGLAGAVLAVPADGDAGTRARADRPGRHPLRHGHQPGPGEGLRRARIVCRTE